MLILATIVCSLSLPLDRGDVIPDASNADGVGGKGVETMRPPCGTGSVCTAPGRNDLEVVLQHRYSISGRTRRKCMNRNRVIRL